MKTPPVIVLTFLLAIIGVWIIVSSRSIAVSAVPFGLPAGTKISIGEKVKFPPMPVPAEADVQRAGDLRAAGALRAAQESYENILLKYPNLPAALFGAAYSMLAEDFVSNQSLAKAKSFTENLAFQMPGSLCVQLLLTFLSEHEGNLSQALDIAENLAKTSPAFSEARLRYADLLLKAGLPEKAAEEAKAAISISVGSETKAYVILAFALHKMGNLDECSKVVNYALPRFPSQTGLLLLNGYLSEYSREFDKAQESYKKILVLKPEDISANNALATLGEKTPPVAGTQASAISIMSLKDQAKEAAKIIMPLIEEYPENLPLREALGKIYLKARLMKEARSQFAEIYAQDFDYPNIKKLLEEASEELPKFIPPPKAEPYKNSKNLADSLAKTFAALRENERHNNDYDELGRYFVPYEAPLKDFFSRYSVTRFQKQDERTFSERYEIGSFFYENTIFFDPKKEFYATRVIISDTTKPNSPDYVPDFYRLFLKKATGIMGEGIAAGATVCNGYEWEGYIWASRSSFEILMHSPKQGRKVFFIRLHARRFLDTGNLCHYVNMATGRSKIPR